MTKAVGALLENFKKRLGKYPNVIQFDEGNEFYNVGVKSLLGDHDFKYFSTNCGNVEIFLQQRNL